MKKKYIVTFNNDDERDRIRKWTGVTSGASLVLKTTTWDDRDDAYMWQTFTLQEGYVIDVTTPKAEMLIRLQFAHAQRYFEQ